MDKIYTEIAEELQLPIEVVKKAYTSYYEYIRIQISNTLLEDKELEDIEDLSFNIPSIGKLYLNKNKLKRIKEVTNKNNIHE